MSLNEFIQRHHHVTLNVGGAQEDFDFHTKVLGLKNVKKTALYDGDEPILHLYYGKDMGEVGALITCFPMRQSGRKARKGSGQISTICLSIPEGSIQFWEKHLNGLGYTTSRNDRFGEKVLALQHPCGIDYELVESPNDDRESYSNGVLPSELGIKGTHGITVALRDSENMDDFMHNGWNGKSRATDRNFIRYELGKGGSGTIIDFHVQPDLAPGSWTYGEGVPHHCAFEVDDWDVQAKVKFRLEGQGYTDVSERKDRGYFDSVYVRTPSGALFEAAVSKPNGFMVDEAYEDLGRSMQVPPVFAHKTDEMLEYLEKIVDERFL